MRAVLFYSKNIDKVKILTERKGVILETHGSKTGLCEMESISPFLRPAGKGNLDAMIEEFLIINVDYIVEFDTDVADTNAVTKAVKDWAVDGVYPKDEGAGWFDGNVKKDWNTIDRGLE